MIQACVTVATLAHGSVLWISNRCRLPQTDAVGEAEIASLLGLVV